MYSISLIGLILAIFEFGIAILSTKEISSKQNHVPVFIQHAFGLRLISYLIAIITLLVLYKYTSLLKHQLIVFTLVIYGVSNSLTIFFRSVFRGFEVMKLEGISIVVDRLLVISLCTIILLVSPSLNIFIIGYSFAFLLSMCFSFILFYRQVPAALPSFDFDKINNLVLKPGYVFAFMNILLIMRRSLPNLFIENLTNSVQVGFYNSGFRLLDSYLLIPMIFITPLYPFFVRLYKRTHILSKLVINSTRVILLITSMVVIPIYIFRDEFTIILYGSEFIEASDTIGILMFCMYAMSLTVIFGSIVSASNRQKKANTLMVFEVIVGIIIFIFSIQAFAAKGASIATLFMEIVLVSIFIYVSRDLITLKPLLILIFRFILVIAISIMLIIFIISTIGTDILIINLLISFSILFGINLIAGTLYISDFKKLSKMVTSKFQSLS